MTSAPAGPIENEGPKILGATLAVTLTALLTFVTRLYVRIRLIRNVGWDDYVMASAMLLCLAGQAVIIPQVLLAAGRHVQDVPEDEYTEAFKLNFVTQPIYLFAICLVKQSIGYFLLRVAVIPFYRRLIISVMAFMGFYTLGCFFTIVLQCNNLAVLWDKNATGTCWGATTLQALSYTNVSLNILTDLLFAVFIPIPMLWNVQMNRRQKYSVMGILGLGVFATVAAFVKVSYLPNYGKEGDWLWDSRNITIWTVVECNIGIVAGNLPCLKPLFRRVLGSTYGLGSNKNSNQKVYHYGTGTGHRAVNNYNSLASGKTQDNEFRTAGRMESHMMSTLQVNEGNSGRTTPGSNGEGGDKSSAENVNWTSEQPFAKWGAITKTTEVNVSASNGEGEIEDMKPERKEAQIV